MDSIPSFDEAANLARVGTGFKGNPFFKDPVLAPAMTIGESWPAEVKEKLSMSPTEAPTPTDPWVVRRFNGQ